jgi:hypothetical protein
MEISRPFPITFIFFKAGIDQEYSAELSYCLPFWTYVYQTKILNSLIPSHELLSHK